jgi:hypothetical protein
MALIPPMHAMKVSTFRGNLIALEWKHATFVDRA